MIGEPSSPEGSQVAMLDSPVSEELEVVAFPLVFRLLAALVGGVLSVWLARLFLSGEMHAYASSAGVDAKGVMVGMVLLVIMLLASVWAISTSRTRLTRHSLHQSWLWDREVSLREVSYIRLVHLPGLDWLVASRAYVRTIHGRHAVFYAADGRMISQFRSIANWVKARQRQAMAR